MYSDVYTFGALQGREEGSRKPTLLAPSAATAAKALVSMAGKGGPVIHPYGAHALFTALLTHAWPPALREKMRLGLGRMIKAKAGTKGF